MFCEPPRHQGVTRGLTQKNSHQGDQVGTGGVVDMSKIMSTMAKLK
jgi:hypothetical protein